MQVNRYLKDKHFDHIDHALGRPVDPMGETYRDHFTACLGSTIAEEMATSPHWASGVVVAGSLAWFYVTPLGREALRDHLKEIGDRHRLYAITWDGNNWTEVAETRSKARWLAFRRASEVDVDLTFKKFQVEATVRVASGNS